MTWNPMRQEFDEDDEGFGLTSFWPLPDDSPLADARGVWPRTGDEPDMGGMTGDDLVRLAERELQDDEKPPTRL